MWLVHSLSLASAWAEIQRNHVSLYALGVHKFHLNSGGCVVFAQEKSRKAEAFPPSSFMKLSHLAEDNGSVCATEPETVGKGDVHFPFLRF